MSISNGDVAEMILDECKEKGLITQAQYRQAQNSPEEMYDVVKAVLARCPPLKASNPATSTLHNPGQ